MPKLAATLVALALAAAPVAGDALVDDYLDRYFATFPSRATAAGRHDLDHQLESLTPQVLAAWTRFNRDTERRLVGELARADLDFELRLDYELLLRQARRQLLRFESAPANPLFWSGVLGNATVLLLVRDDLPLPVRLDSAIARARRIPRLAAEARRALETTPKHQISPELAAMAARQTASTARFYREGFAGAAAAAPAVLRDDLTQRLALAGSEAAIALAELGAFLEKLADEATGSFRLGADAYAERFHTVTGIADPVPEVLARAERALVEKRREAAIYGRSVWRELMPGEPPAADEMELLAALFDRVERDIAGSVEEFVGDYERAIAESSEFVRERELITLPEPLTLEIGRSPSYFVGQSVGGVYSAGPFAPADAATLLFLPMPPADADRERQVVFLRAFNDHFNAMIVPHEVIPGHYLQLKWAARHPHKVRALFADGVYVEGWGTFCERLMLDLGWGGPLERLAHLKKQLENIARTIVDIRVHTQNASREEVLAFVRGEALQDEQFAANMWRRAMTTSPQLTYYFLGYEQVRGLYDDVRAARGSEFELRAFMDGMMELGPVAVRHYRERMLAAPGEETP